MNILIPISFISLVHVQMLSRDVNSIHEKESYLEDSVTDTGLKCARIRRDVTGDLYVFHLSS